MCLDFYKFCSNLKIFNTGTFYQILNKYLKLVVVSTQCLKSFKKYMFMLGFIKNFINKFYFIIIFSEFTWVSLKNNSYEF